MSKGFWDSEFGKKAISDGHTIFLKRFGLPEEVANVASFLASNESSFITGETIIVSGGTNTRL